MKRIIIVLSALLLMALAGPAAEAHAWSSPYYWYQESYGLYTNNVDTRCGAGDTWVCMKYKAAGYPFGSTYEHTTPNCYGKDWDGDGDFHIGLHNFEMRCWWGERSVFIVDTRKCNGWYEVDGLTTGDQTNIVKVYQGRSCSGDWDG